MALADIAMGKEVPGYQQLWDYSHVLPVEHRQNYRLMVRREPSKYPGNRERLVAQLKYLKPGMVSPHMTVGEVTGYLGSGEFKDIKSGDKIDTIEPHSTLWEEHRGKGLGLASYEALFAHAKHSGIKTVRGGIHSKDAARVHKKLAARHGMEYKARTSTVGMEPTDKAPYQYALKSELGTNAEGSDLQDRYTFQGLPIAVENEKGSTRKWHDEAGKESGSTKMNHDYGYIEDCLGSDDEPVDVYVGPDEDAEMVYVIHQNKAPDFTEYDEEIGRAS